MAKFNKAKATAENTETIKEVKVEEEKVILEPVEDKKEEVKVEPETVVEIEQPKTEAKKVTKVQSLADFLF